MRTNKEDFGVSKGLETDKEVDEASDKSIEAHNVETSEKVSDTEGDILDQKLLVKEIEPQQKFFEIFLGSSFNI